MTPLQVVREMSKSPSNASEWSNPDMENHPPLGSPSSTTGAQSAGRILYCRKCEGHGEKVVLKNHTPNCPYILCTCKSCERLNQKRLKSFSKRNKDKLKLAAELCEKRRQERESRSGMSSRKISSSSTATTSSTEAEMDSDSSPTRTGIESRSMSLGAMTVMSYDIWKAKCAAEKKKKEEERKASLASQTMSYPTDNDDDLKPISRKRANTTICPMEPYRDIPKISPPNVKEKKGRYILLPTIPALKFFVDDESNENPASSTTTTSTSSDVATTTSSTPIPNPSVLPSTSTPTPFPITASASSTTIPSIPATASPMLTVSSFPTVTTGMNFLPTQPTVSQVPITSMTSAASMTVPATGISSPFLMNHNQLQRNNVNMSLPQPTTTASMMSADQLVSLLNPQILLQTSLLQQQQQQQQQQQAQQQNACLQQLLSILTANQATQLPQQQQQVPVPVHNQPDLLAILRNQQQLHQQNQAQHQAPPPQPQHPLYITTQPDHMSLTSAASDDLLKTLLAMRQQPIFSNTV